MLIVIFPQLVTLELPFGETPERLTGKQWYEKLVVENCRPLLPTSLSENLRIVIEKGMNTDPNLRPDALEVFRAIDDVIKGKV